jgi:hypothetical protein
MLMDREYGPRRVYGRLFNVRGAATHRCTEQPRGWMRQIPPQEPNYMLQQTGATGIRLCTSVRYLNLKITSPIPAAPCS